MNAPPPVAAVPLLQRELPEDYVREATASVAAPLQPREADGHAVLLFRIGAEWLALPAGVFDEVTEPRKPHALPMRRSGALLGVVNVRGELLACVSLASLLGIPPSQADDPRRARLLVVQQARHRRVTFPADEVHGVWRYRQGDLATPPATMARGATRYTHALLAWGQRSVGLLDETPLFQALERSLA